MKILYVKKTSANDITLIMMNTDLLQEFQARPTPTRKAEPVRFLYKY